MATSLGTPIAGALLFAFASPRRGAACGSEIESAVHWTRAGAPTRPDVKRVTTWLGKLHARAGQSTRPYKFTSIAFVQTHYFA